MKINTEKHKKRAAVFCSRASLQSWVTNSQL